jgi:hypothetical protein
MCLAGIPVDEVLAAVEKRLGAVAEGRAGRERARV